MEQRIMSLVKGTIDYLGFDLVSVTRRGSMIEVLIEGRNQHKVSINDCQIVSKHIRSMLDVQEIIRNRFSLSVSSTGVERSLINLADYDKFVGHQVKIKLKAKLNECIQYKGYITKVCDKMIWIDNEGQEIVIPFNLVKNGNLVLTSAMLNKFLKRVK